MGFLQDNGLDPKGLDAEAILKDFREDMGRGLAGEGPLPMLPAAFPLRGDLPRNCEIPAFDVGGTNIRSARIRFNAHGEPTVLNQLRGFMPGSRGPVDHATFYRILCDVLVPNVRAGESVGYCFSYPVDELGTLLFWTKGIQAPSVMGSNVMRDLEAALEERGLKDCTVCVLNDTVAALLAAYAHHADTQRAGYVGFILGTGSNTAYAETVERIVKAPGLPRGCHIPINCESGNFSRFPRSRFDERYEALSGNGRAQWERCISGVHLGPLGTEILHAAAEAGLFSPGVRDAVLARTFTNVELDGFCSGKMPDVLYCTAEEARTVRGLICPMYERAARFAAINIAAAALRSAEARDMRSGTIRVNADGSTFWKTASVPFVDLVRADLEALLSPRGFSFEIVRIDDAPLIGAALAVR